MNSELGGTCGSSTTMWNGGGSSATVARCGVSWELVVKLRGEQWAVFLIKKMRYCIGLILPEGGPKIMT